MADSELTRREFQQLALAAFGGIWAGVNILRADEEEKRQDDQDEKKDKKKNPLLSEPHVCRGLNTCKNKGGCGESAGKNECAGRGECASVDFHGCHGGNDCRGQGGCGKKPGENECKGQGECAVPMEDEVWEVARKRFEEEMQKAGKAVGPAPPPRNPPDRLEDD
jgi:hypothetical protein